MQRSLRNNSMFAHVCVIALTACSFGHGVDVLPEKPDCGQQIVNSSLELKHVAQEGEFPWTALLKYEGSRSSKCVGSLIGDRYVLTTGHCVTHREVVGVVLGVHSLNQIGQGEEYAVEKVISHEDYDSENRELNNDIALIKLGTPVSFSDRVRPICLPESMSIRPKDVAVLAGWGRRAAGDSASEKKVNFRQVITTEECRQRYAMYKIPIIDNFLCTEYLKSYEDCNYAGDEGAPLMFKNEDTWYQQGILSFAGATCSNDLPDGNIRVSQYVTWINDTITQN